MIIVLCGFSASGKDTYMKLILEKYADKINRPITFTTRPKRDGEIHGVDYLFIDNREFELRLNSKQIINHRKYNVIDNGLDNVWHYGIPSDFDKFFKNQILILDPYGAAKMKEKYGDDLKIIYFECADSVARQRVLKRGDSLDELFRRRKDDKEQFYLIKNIIDVSINTNANGMFENNMKTISNFLEDKIE